MLHVPKRTQTSLLARFTIRLGQFFLTFISFNKGIAPIYGFYLEVIILFRANNNNNNNGICEANWKSSIALTYYPLAIQNWSTLYPKFCIFLNGLISKSSIPRMNKSNFTTPPSHELVHQFFSTLE